jgi:dipeptidyl aminopeptidase/acylaminoacyl peptidase
MMIPMRAGPRLASVAGAMVLILGLQHPAPGQAQGPKPPKPMTLVDLIGVPRITDPQLSPDGRFVTYNLARNDWKANRQIPQVWKQGVAGGAPMPLTSGGAASSARWSPDGRTLLYMSGGQIHLVPAEGGASRQLTHHATNVSASMPPMRMPAMPTWSPDGSTIYFVASDTRPASDRAVTDYVTTVGESNVPQHLWRASVATGAEARITAGDWSVLGYRLSRDGRRITMLRAPTIDEGDHYHSEVWVMDVDGRNARALTSNSLYEIDAELSPDNSQAWFLVDANEKFEPYYGHSLFVVPASGGATRMLTPRLGHEIDFASWTPDGKAILAVVNVGVQQEIYRIDASTGAATALTNGHHGIPFWNLVPSANRMVFQLDEPTRLGDVWTLPTEGGTPTRVTGLYDSLASDFALPRQDKVTWKGADGVTIEGVLFYPLGYQQGRRYPLVVQLHSGPAESDKFGFGPAVIFNYVPVLTARGYAVLRPNYRGSAGYGSAFVRDIIGHYFNNMHLDVMAGVDALVQQGIADPDRLAVMGQSAGGHLVNKLITFTDRFKFASSAAGVSNWVSMMAQTDAVARRTFWMGGTPWQGDAPMDVIWNSSPIKDVAKARTPTLFVAGEMDQRVPLAQVLEMYRGLESNGVPTRLIVGKSEGHTWTQPQTTFVKDNIELEWLEKYVMNRGYQPEVAPTPPTDTQPGR